MDVVKNRVANKNRWRDTICGVVTQPAQFSWYAEHEYQIPKDPLQWEEYILHVYRNEPIELKAWKTCFLLAYQNYFYSHEDVTGGADHYMTVDEYQRRGKSWDGTSYVATIHNHMFFKTCRGGSCLSF
jgi:hypothetical protein